MNRSHPLKMVNIVLICILPLFAACEEKEEEFCNFIDLATTFCLNKVIEGALTGTLPRTATGGNSGGSSNQTPILINEFDEYEPNSTLNNANPVYFPPTDSVTREGIKVLGVVHEINDMADYFVFTPTRSGDYRISVSTGNCSCIASSQGVYLMIYDQSQTTISSTPIATETLLLLDARLTAGLAYYVEVNGMDTLGVHFTYYLTVEERD